MLTLVGALFGAGAAPHASAAEEAWKVTGFAIPTAQSFTADGAPTGPVSADAFTFPVYVAPEDVSDGLVPVGDMGDPVYVREIFLKIQKGACPPSISSANNVSDSLATSGAGAGCE